MFCLREGWRFSSSEERTPQCPGAGSGGGTAMQCVWFLAAALKALPGMYKWSLEVTPLSSPLPWGFGQVA